MNRGIYLFPSLFTLGNMGLGFFSIFASIQGHYTQAATAIIFSHVLDIFDGRVARLTKSESKFGVEFDSYADWMSFGIAPAVMMYQIVLHTNKLWGLPLAFLFVVTAALRLARFNLKSLSGEKVTPYFVGLPTPVAGGTLAILVLLFEISNGAIEAKTIEFLMRRVPLFYAFLPGIMFLLSVLMVSRFRYSNFKQINLFRPRTLRSFFLSILVLTMAYVYPQNTIFFLYTAYVISGFGEYFLRVYHMRRKFPHGAEEVQEEHSHGN